MPQVSENYIETRKSNITKAAVKVFAKKGYSNATMKDVMEEAKVSRGGLYAHFNNIDSVFLAVLRYDDTLPHNQFLVPNSKQPLFKQLKKWLGNIELSIQNTEASLVRAKSEFFLLHDVSEVPYLCERHQKLADDIQSFVSIGIETGEFRKEIDIKAFAEVLIAVVDGIMLHRYYRFSVNIKFLDIFNFLNTVFERTLLKGE